MDLRQLSQAISPNTSATIPIYFQPGEEILHEETLNFFIIDSCMKKDITIKGEGIAYKVSNDLRIFFVYPGDAFKDKTYKLQLFCLQK